MKHSINHTQKKLKLMYQQVEACSMLLTSAYFLPQFGYCPFFWMNHSRILNNRINGLQEGAHKLAYSFFSSTFSEFLTKNESVTIHQQNLQTLAQ